MNLKDKTRIFIIESPSETDISHNRKEGLALSEMLKLANIENIYFQVSDKVTFSECLEKILQVESKKERFPTLHFSLHGNEDGIALTNQEFLTWEQLYEGYLKSFIEKLGYEETNIGNIVAPLHLHFSVCKGFYGKKVKEFAKHSPYISLVGPIVEVNWSDSLLAFMTFYHNTIHKPIGPRTAAQKMNLAANLDNVFQVDLAENFRFTK
ncbi:hypothetical protein [Terrimonas pollutisoli]|uniref:hypothetical protein n=1 Tax=Terrimonas pollutisoli TaxID=3034147 RepID=UPI0023EB7FC2|nr:hypothetical protein [Terrimonas sp. H1YJ31]